LAEFEVQALLGTGGFGMVYRAYDHSLHRTVAIKEYLPSALAGHSGTGVVLRKPADAPLFEAGLRSFLAEARLLAQFDHPSLVKVFRVWEQNDTAYMVMPCYQGMTLRDACALMRQPPPEAWLRKLLWSLLQALEQLHGRQLVHRDISPDNIFLQDVGPPVLLDLGAARQALGEAQRQHTAIVKVHYAPIEQYADTLHMRQGPWSDVYALSAVVYGCLHRAPPVPATTRVLRDEMLTPADVAEGLRATAGLAYSAPLVLALTRGLAVAPADRPQDLAAFRALLALEPVSGMDRFDWRAELGAALVAAPQPLAQERQQAATQWLAPGHRPAEPQRGGEPPLAPSSQPLGKASAPAPVEAAPRLPEPPPTAAEPSPVRVPMPPVVARVTTPRRWWPAAALASLIVGLLVAMAMVAAPRPAGVAPAVPVAKPATAASGAAPAVVASTAPTEPTALVSARELAPSVPPAAPLAVTPVASAPSAASAPVEEVLLPATAPSVAPAHPPTTPAVREPRRPARPARALTAEEICPDSNFLTRPMCLHRECSKAAYALMPVCVENTRRLQANDRAHGG
jgi:hypothetical protein